MLTPASYSGSGELVWLGEPASHDVLLTGAKAAHLGRLSALHRVPPGFCLTAEAHRRAVLGGLTPALRDALAAGYARLAQRTGLAEPCVAVRSSAIDEDGPTASFAGQHDTFLNISGVDAVADAIERCWASARAEAVLTYRRQHGLPLDDLRLAVLVQQLAPADVSIVMFSANPVSGARDELLITASWGLGESIVGGTVTPDSWRVSKVDLEPLETRLGAKQRMTVAIPGGTREVDVPRLLRGQLTLSAAQLLEVAQLGLALEAQMGWPVDVECAYAGGQLYLLQCRPITTLSATQAARPATTHAPPLLTTST
jgi:phosphoenolpyruvate synthase/pyruvate phosphate dikinase